MQFHLSQVSVSEIDFRRTTNLINDITKNNDLKPEKPFMKQLENMTWSVAHGLI